MDKTLKIINQLEAQGVIGRYAIGGAIAIMFYCEPTATYDIDIFCYLPNQDGLLINLGPLYGNLLAKGYPSEAEHIVIEGIPVQFLVPPPGLIQEALDNAVEDTFEDVPTRVFQYEHLLAIMVQVGRDKDKIRITTSLESKEPDQAKLDDLLKRYDLMDKWLEIVSGD